MHILQYLADPKCEHPSRDVLTSEYRLLCSGLVYRDVGSDPFECEHARILLDPPLILFAVSRPLEGYPIELALEISVQRVEERQKGSAGEVVHSWHPSDEVARDLAAALCLLVRRLITICGTVSEQNSDCGHPLFGGRPYPMPLVTRASRSYWRPHPLSVIYSSLGSIEYRDYNPQPKAIDPCRLTELLLSLPKMDHATSLVAAIRLYALAIELIHERPDIAYTLLISSIETMSSATLEDYEPDHNTMVRRKNAVYAKAVGMRLGAAKATELAIAACKGERWVSKKFKKFIVDHVDDSFWTEADELFHRLPAWTLPQRDQFEQTLGSIYATRSRATHAGEAFPLSATYTGGPSINPRAADLFYGTAPAFPPVVWFERVVNMALVNFWQRAVG